MFIIFFCHTTSASVFSCEGCDQGFGYLLAKRLDGAGYKVFAGCLDAEGEGAANLRNETSQKLEVLQLDVSKEDQIEAARVTVADSLEGRGELITLRPSIGAQTTFGIPAILFIMVKFVQLLFRSSLAIGTFCAVFSFYKIPQTHCVCLYNLSDEELSCGGLSQNKCPPISCQRVINFEKSNLS